MKLLLLVALLGVAYVAAECPEACNGHGFCGEYDKCSCYRNWQGNSCADRTCPFDLAFVDIPHGDLNMNGKLDDEITLYGAQINDVYAFEVYPTDGYQINRGGICYAAGQTAPSGTKSLDADNNPIQCNEDVDCPDTGDICLSDPSDASSDDSMYTYRTLREKAASFYDMAEDGHFYAECSNKGMCDRKSGQCDCFDGYSGTACRRVACPNDCSGHGTCETIAETATGGDNYVLWDRYKTQVCSCDPGYFGIDCAQRHCPYGDDPLSADEHNEVQWLTLRSHGLGTNGPSGSGALTPTGTFRLAYLDEYGETWNTSPIGAAAYNTHATNGPPANDAVAAAIKAALEGIPNSVFEEVTVELWPIQAPLPGEWTCSGTACTIAAGSAAKHMVIAATKVKEFGKTSEQTDAADAAAGGLSVDSNGNSTIGIDSNGVLTGNSHKWGVSTCYQAGHASAKFATGVTFRGGACSVANCGDGSEACPTDTACDAADAGNAWTYDGSIVGADLTAASYTLCRYDMNGFRAKITFTKNPGDINELTCDADLVTTAEHIDSDAPSTDIVCTAKDQLNLELGAIGTVTGSTIGGGNGGQIQTNMDLSQTMTHGDRLQVQGKCSDFDTNSEHCWTDADCVTGTNIKCEASATGGQAPALYTIAGPTKYNGDDAELTVIIVEEETAATTALDHVQGPAAHWLGKGTTENTECSHRGLCNHDEGLCECFTGYTHDDCSMQDALNA